MHPYRNKMHPYIGITGFTDAHQVRKVASVVPEDTAYQFMCGVLASSRSLRGEPSKKYPRRYPDPRLMRHIFQPLPNALNLIHFATDEPQFLLRDLLYLRHLGGPHCHGFQLNMVWPDRNELRAYRECYPGDTIVLQCGARAMHKAADSPAILSSFAASYDGLVNYLLIDPSGGKGIPYDPKVAATYLYRLHADNDNEIRCLGIGIAGGLSPYNLDTQVVPLLGLFPFSVDAEGQLRDNNDELSIPDACEYLRRMYGYFPTPGPRGTGEDGVFVTLR